MYIRTRIHQPSSPSPPPYLFFLLFFFSLSLLVLTLFPLLFYYVLNIVIARLGEILTGRNPIMGSWIQFSRIVMEDEGTGQENFNRSDGSTVYLYLCVCVSVDFHEVKSQREFWEELQVPFLFERSCGQHTHIETRTHIFGFT